MTRKRRKKVTIKGKGKKPLKFNKGALHRALHVPEGQPIPPGKKRAALSGRLGKKIKRMAVFGFKGALAKGRQTARRHIARRRATNRRRRLA